MGPDKGHTGAMVEKRNTVCLFCSLGCGVAFRTSNDLVTAIDYDKENPVNFGSLCPRGYYNLELINHPQRLMYPQVGRNKVSWDEAISFAKKELEKCGPSSIGIALSSNSSNEDAYMAGLMAKELGIKTVITSGDAADTEAYQGNKWQVEGATLGNIDDIGSSESLLIIGDILTRSPVLSKRINQVKYGKRGNQIIVIDPNVSHTSWFATIHLKNKPGIEALLMAAILSGLEGNKRGKIDIDMDEVSKAVGISADTITRAAKAFDSASSGTVIFSPSKNIQRNDLVQYFAKTATSLSLNKKHITFHGYGNTLGVNMMIDSMVEDRGSEPDIKALISISDDIDIPATKFAIRACYFAPDTVRENTVLLPLASQMEAEGTVMLAGGRIESFKPLAPKVGGMTGLEIMSLISGIKITQDEASEETGKILAKGIKEEKVDLKKKISEALDIRPKAAATLENITHFGDNGLVKRFFWYRVNNKNG
jgi:NADH dehydrogenase/NADH:ubiquinone oxidoreductase subunit G